MNAFAMKADSQAPLLEIKDVTKRFGGLVALDKVSFSLTPGEIIGLIGPNGAGKTTLVNVITGMQQADSGEIFFQGTPLHRLAAYQIARRGIGRTTQSAWPPSSMESPLSANAT